MLPQVRARISVHRGCAPGRERITRPCGTGRDRESVPTGCPQPLPGHVTPAHISSTGPRGAGRGADGAENGSSGTEMRATPGSLPGVADTAGPSERFLESHFRAPPEASVCLCRPEGGEGRETVPARRRGPPGGRGRPAGRRTSRAWQLRDQVARVAVGARLAGRRPGAWRRMRIWDRRLVRNRMISDRFRAVSDHSWGG